MNRPRERLRLDVRGLVQGVGFRPFAHRLAHALKLSGWVRNEGGGVIIEAQGARATLDLFRSRLVNEAPAHARIDAVSSRCIATVDEDENFIIAPSPHGHARTAPPPDICVCDACVHELFDASARHYLHPFIHCAHCGPRYTLTDVLPFDRARTRMCDFAPCPACEREYADPRARRFHAQTLCCPACGPRLVWHDREGAQDSQADVIAQTIALLRAGGIVAVKGVGGFHLVCDARNAGAVARLRERKRRAEKPLAVMALNTASLAAWTVSTAEERKLLESAARPIVLLEKNDTCDDMLRGVAPGLAHLGVMLPYTPLHFLLFHEAAGRPQGDAWRRAPHPLALVMTSANEGGEPLIISNDEALARLREITDAFVLHDRAIARRCDDSVMRCQGAAPVFIRRARGFAPLAIKLPRAGPSVLACGGDLKNTLCLTRDDEAFLSPHIGDLHSAAACRVMEETVEQFMRLLDIEPARVACDPHPDFFSARFAARFADTREIPCRAVQHHHAHIAAVIAERGIERPVLGLALDGFGYGANGEAWGGELLLVQEASCVRTGHLQTLALPGGDRAAREPWRMAAAALHTLGRGAEITKRFHPPAAATVQRLLENENAPRTSSAGRWFDAAAGLLGVMECASYEGQAAMYLETLALRHGPAPPLADTCMIESDGVLNLSPLLAYLADENDAARGAAVFHASFARALSIWVRHAAARAGVRDIALAGGCFMNPLLSETLCGDLRAAGLSVHTARAAPPNDGAISLGQAWVAMHYSSR